MTKWTEQMKKKLQSVARETAENSVGRSVPRVFHEPEMPTCLKAQAQEKAED